MEKESTKKILPPFLLFFGVCLILILLENLGLLRLVRRGTESVTTPLKMVIFRAWQKTGLGSSVASDIGPQIRELATLRVKLQVLEDENKSLRKQLEAPLPPTMKFLPAKTIGLTRFLTIDKGDEDGVKVGMTVISENILVGKVNQVTPKTAQIILPTDPDSKIQVRTIKTGAKGLALGEFGTKAVLDKVLQAERLEKDDLVVTTGEEGDIKDLLIGKLGKIEKEEVQPFQKAEIIPLLDYGKLVDVFVVLK